MHGVFRGKLPAMLNCVFKVFIYGYSLPLKLAHITRTHAHNNGNVDAMTRFPRVFWGALTRAHEASFKHLDDIIAVDEILGLAHVIPFNLNGDNTQWLVNNLIDLKTWSEVYEDEDL